jgi:hypothetical protein
VGYLASAGHEASSPRHVLIISRYHPGLFEYVRARFADEDRVEVLLDRRRGRDRRIIPARPAVDRRTAERRVRSHVDAALRMESMQFVTISPGVTSASPPAPEGDVTTG